MKILLVDDHPAIREGTRSLLDVVDGMEVVGEARDAEGAVWLAAEFKPDLVVLDLRLKGGTCGLQACREMKLAPEPPQVLIHSAHNAAEDLALAVLSGADGYLHKGAEHVEFAEVVKRTHAGEQVWLVDVEPEEVKARLVNTLRNAQLTPKEREVLALMLEHHPNADIARELYLSLPTVKTHVRNILRKLGIRNRRELFF